MSTNTITLILPDDLAARLAILPDEEARNRFAVAALAAGIAALDADKGDDEAQTVTAVEEALAQMDAGRGLVSFEEASHRWAEDKAARRRAAR